MSSNRNDALNRELKNIYENRKPEQLQNRESGLFEKIKVSATKPLGNGTYGAAISSGNQSGLHSQNELEALATPDTQQVEQWVVTPKVLTNQIQLSGLYYEVAKGNDASFAEGLTLQMDEGLSDASKELNQQLYRTGSGQLALVNGAVSASTTVTVDASILTHFQIDEPVDIFDSAGAIKQVDGVKISAIDISNSTITLASAQTCDDDGVVYRKGVNDNAPTSGKELSGLPRITDDGTDFATYEGITRSGSGFVDSWKGLEIDASSGNLSDDLLQRAYSQMYVYSGTKPNQLVPNTSQYRKYLSTTLPEVRFNGGENRDSGVKSMMPTWNGIPWLVDTDCGFDEIYLLNMDYIEKFEVHPLKFDSTDGNILKNKDGFDAFYAYAKYYGDVGTRAPRKAAIRIHTLAQPTF